jgi:TATA-box binding protein (TBP) (component of TFIID and TFIIIB)
LPVLTRAAIEARLLEFGREFLECMSSVNRTVEGLRHVRITPPAITTITFTGVLDVRSVPVDDMRLAVELMTELGDEPEFRLDCDLEKRRARGESRAPAKRFRYQLPLKRHGKSVKLFHNGSVQATGCGSAPEFLDMIQGLERFVHEASDAAIELEDFQFQLINVLFVLTCPRTGRPLCIAPRALMKRMAMRADFDTERHPSVKIPVLDESGAKVATACIFQTGSVSVMGAKRPRHLALAIRTVCRAVDEHAPDVCTPDPVVTIRTTTARQPLVLDHGYPFNLVMCCAT